MMKELTNRSKTKNVLAKLNELHQAKKLFKKDGSIREDLEVHPLVRDAVRELGLHLKKHAGIETQATISEDG